MAIILPQSAAINWGNPVNQASPLNRGLVSWWLGRGPTVGSGTWFDLCKRNNGTLTNGPTWSATAPSYRLRSLLFDGSDDYVSLASPALNAVTIEFIARADTDKAMQAAVGVSASYAALRRVSGGTVRLTESGGLSLIDWSSAWTNLSVDYHFVYTQSNSGPSSTVELFANGVSSGTASVNAPFISGLTFGQYVTYFAAHSFSGTISSVRLYSRAISASEAYQVYQDSLTGYQRTLNRLTRIIPASSGAAAATFNPGWARNSTTLIGAGSYA